VLATGVASGLGTVAIQDWGSRLSDFEESETINPDPRNGFAEPSPHDHTEKAWRLRRARRSVLKDEAAPLQLVNNDNAYDRVGQFGRPRDSPSGDVLNGTAVSGQFQLLTRASIDSPAALWSVDQLPGQVAYFALGVPVGEPEFGVQGAVTTGDSGSWVIAGSIATDTFQNHALELGMSYSKQRPLRDELVLTAANVETENFYDDRSVASVTADGTLALSSMLSVAYGATIAHHGYLESGRLLSPRAQMAVEPTSGTRVRAAISRNMLAPGAEEFLPPSSGIWLPPERTFAPLSVTVPLKPQRTSHIEVALEQDVGVSSMVGIRRFHQDVTAQMFTLFGVKRSTVGSVGDHYYLTNANGVNSTGWGVSFSHELPGRLHGVVDYSATRAHWAPWSVADFSSDTIGASRTGTERFHDITTSVETEIPETATHVFVLARLNTAFSQVRAGSLTAGLNTRFALRVKQTLPFAPFAGSNWAVLVDVRNLFREQVEGASVYDELLVVNPPKQFVGGLVVHF
jgi:outer membrane receptor protein involved in Fe transport